MNDLAWIIDLTSFIWIPMLGMVICVFFPTFFFYVVTRRDFSKLLKFYQFPMWFKIFLCVLSLSMLVFSVRYALSFPEGSVFATTNMFPFLKVHFY